MGRLASLGRLSPAERRTLALAWALLLVAPLLLRVVSLRRLLVAPWRRRAAGLPPETVARLVEVASRRAPGAQCLAVALVTAWLLARQGTPVTLRIGVARRADRLTAHAWLELHGRPLLDASQSDGYTPILAASVSVP
jgi:hypothetical protein